MTEHQIAYLGQPVTIENVPEGAAIAVKDNAGAELIRTVVYADGNATLHFPENVQPQRIIVEVE